jgi:formylglycine-generating enzyme required for sulfatase activity
VQGVDTGDFPVEQVTYADALAFIERLNARDKRRSGWKYALPTEAQWEYACRGGPDASNKPIRFAKPQDSLSASEANFAAATPYNGGKAGAALNRTCKAGSYRPNNLGIYDVHGNVWEWCSDWYGSDYGGADAVRDPTGAKKGSMHVLKGGSYYDRGWEARAARRYPGDSTDSRCGFRVALVQAR